MSNSRLSSNYISFFFIKKIISYLKTISSIRKIYFFFSFLKRIIISFHIVLLDLIKTCL